MVATIFRLERFVSNKRSQFSLFRKGAKELASVTSDSLMIRIGLGLILRLISGAIIDL